MKQHRLVGMMVVAGIAALPLSAVAQQPVAKKVYCWNDNGRRVCSDVLPPEQAARAREEISASSGRTLSQIGRTLTAEERAAAEVAAKQAQQAAEVEASRQRRDLAMVESYVTEDDLRRAFNERIVLVDESIKGSALSEANLRLGLVGLLGQATNLELAGKPVPKLLQDRILSQRGELNKQLAILDAQRTERGALDGEFNAALQRYRDLKAAATPAPAPTDP